MAIADGTRLALPAGMQLRSLILIVLFAIGCGGTEGDPNGGPDGAPGTGSHASDMAGEAVGLMDGKLGSPCTTADNCDSHLCNPYPAKGGNKCTNSCNASNVATNCPAPAVGCNNMGVCKF